MKLKDTVAFVTGANDGIGKALVNELIKRRAAKVYAAARKPESLESLKARYGEKVVVMPLDVTSESQIGKAAMIATDVTLLVNNAGITKDEGFVSASDIEPAITEMDVNYFGPIRMIREFAPILKENGGGAILNILSLLSMVAMPMAGSYSASKAAALSMTKGIRAELSAQNTLVVGSMPAQVDTALAKNYPEPKATTIEVATESLNAIEEAEEEVYPGILAKKLLPTVLRDPKSIEVAMSEIIPQVA